MTPEPRQRDDYSDRQVAAAHRVLIDLGQVLASFSDCLVVIGGWVPDLLLPEAEEPHVGSIDVDLALDAAKLNEGRYAELLKLLLDTTRYQQGEKHFQLVATVDLKDGEQPVQVEVEFLASREVRLKKNKPKLLAGFRVLQADGCDAAFHAPVEHSLSGKNLRGAANTVRLRVASLPDFLVMKAHAIGGRDKPKDSYDLCYTLEHLPGGMDVVAKQWAKRSREKNVTRAVEILREKFASVRSFGPQQVVEFHNAADKDEQGMQARRAYELVQRFLTSYEETVKRDMDLWLFDQIQSVKWGAVERCADLGCGTGRTAAWLASKGVRAIDGVDATPEMLDHARQRDLFASLRVADVGGTGLPAAHYDLVTTCLVDEHLTELAPLYTEAARLARPGAAYVLVGFHPFFIMAAGMPTHFQAADGKPLAIETHVHLLSDHAGAALAAGWQLAEFREQVIDDRWVETKPSWAAYRDVPISFAWVWRRDGT